MSLDYMTYVGPFIECKVGTEQRAAVSQDDVVEDKRIGERLHAPPSSSNEFDGAKSGFHYYLPNVSWTERKDSFDPKTDVFLHEFVTTIPEDLARFTAFFADELAFLKEIYGAEAVRVCWGYGNFIW